MAAFDLAVALGAAGWDVAMADAEIVEMPGEVRTELRPVVGLDGLDRDGKPLAELLNEVDSRADRVVVVDLQDAVPCGFVNGGGLVEPTGGELEMNLAGDLRTVVAAR
jgi:hypothetical protein